MANEYIFYKDQKYKDKGVNLSTITDNQSLAKTFGLSSITGADYDVNHENGWWIEYENNTNKLIYTTPLIGEKDFASLIKFKLGNKSVSFHPTGDLPWHEVTRKDDNLQYRNVNFDYDTPYAEGQYGFAQKIHFPIHGSFSSKLILDGNPSHIIVGAEHVSLVYIDVNNNRRYDDVSVEIQINSFSFDGNDYSWSGEFVCQTSTAVYEFLPDDSGLAYMYASVYFSIENQFVLGLDEVNLAMPLDETYLWDGKIKLSSPVVETVERINSYSAISTINSVRNFVTLNDYLVSNRNLKGVSKKIPTNKTTEYRTEHQEYFRGDTTPRNVWGFCNDYIQPIADDLTTDGFVNSSDTTDTNEYDTVKIIRSGDKVSVYYNNTKRQYDYKYFPYCIITLELLEENSREALYGAGWFDQLSLSNLSDYSEGFHWYTSQGPTEISIYLNNKESSNFTITAETQLTHYLFSLQDYPNIQIGTDSITLLNKRYSLKEFQDKFSSHIRSINARVQNQKIFKEYDWEFSLPNIVNKSLSSYTDPNGNTTNGRVADYSEKKSNYSQITEVLWDDIITKGWFCTTTIQKKHYIRNKMQRVDFQLQAKHTETKIVNSNALTVQLDRGNYTMDDVALADSIMFIQHNKKHIPLPSFISVISGGDGASDATSSWSEFLKIDKWSPLTTPTPSQWLYTYFMNSMVIARMGYVLPEQDPGVAVLLSGPGIN